MKARLSLVDWTIQVYKNVICRKAKLICRIKGVIQNSFNFPLKKSKVPIVIPVAGVKNPTLTIPPLHNPFTPSVLCIYLSALKNPLYFNAISLSTKLDLDTCIRSLARSKGVVIQLARAPAVKLHVSVSLNVKSADDEAKRGAVSERLTVLELFIS